MISQAVAGDADRFKSMLEEVVKADSLFSRIALNANGVPQLSANNPLHMGIFALFVEYMGDYANAPNLAKVLSVAPLTCKNWIKAHEASGLEIPWTFGKGTKRPHFEVKSWGFYNRECFEPIVPLVRAIIDAWIEHKNDNQ